MLSKKLTKYRYKSKRKNVPSIVYASNQIGVFELKDYIENCEKNDQFLFSQNFSKLKVEVIGSSSDAETKKNIRKNRYDDIIPSNYFRVILNIRTLNKNIINSYNITNINTVKQNIGNDHSNVSISSCTLMKKQVSITRKNSKPKMYTRQSLVENIKPNENKEICNEIMNFDNLSKVIEEATKKESSDDKSIALKSSVDESITDYSLTNDNGISKTSSFEYNKVLVNLRNSKISIKSVKSIEEKINGNKKNKRTSDSSEKNNFNKLSSSENKQKSTKKLKSIDVCNLNYINASFIHGYYRMREYIAAQGPMKNTINDFYRMLWEYDIKTIIMLTNWEEGLREKCFRYIPELSDSVELKDTDELVAKCVAIEHVSDCIILSLIEIRQKNQNTVKIVKHFHYVGWPDHGCPDQTSAINDLITLRAMAREWQPVDVETPIVLHCSAGVGRTGAFAAFDYNICRLESGEETFDVMDYIINIRKRRPFMVQTESQFVFIHHLLLLYMISKQDKIPIEVYRKTALKALMGKRNIVSEVYVPIDFREQGSTLKKCYKILRPTKEFMFKYIDDYNDICYCEEMSILEQFIPKKYMMISDNPRMTTIQNLFTAIRESEIKVIIHTEAESLSSYNYFDFEGKTCIDGTHIETLSVETFEGIIVRKLMFHFGDKNISIIHLHYKDFELEKSSLFSENLYSFVWRCYKLCRAYSKSEKISCLFHCSHPDTMSCVIITSVLALQYAHEYSGYISIQEVIYRVRMSRPTAIPTTNDYYKVLDITSKLYKDYFLKNKLLSSN